MRFQDIPQFTRDANYRCNVSWRFLESQLKQYADIGLDMDPDFQRVHVWTEEQQRRYVQFILRGGKTGRDILWNCKHWQERTANWGTIELVDGKQRLEAVRKFLRNELTIFNQLRFSDFEDKLPGMCGPDFVFHVNNLPTRQMVLQWYLDINSGGTPHTEAEIAKVEALLDKIKSA